MGRRSSALLSLFALVSFPLLLTSHTTSAKGPDPAERGLDVFVHAAPTVIAGDNLALDVRAYGFPSVTVAKPLPAANVVVVWDPESLGPGTLTAPADVSITTDALGQGRIDIPVPKGDTRKISLLVSVRHGEHTRTRKVEISRTANTRIEVRVPDANVVPGSQVPAWVTVTDARTNRALQGAGADVALLEGDVERSSTHITTDASGFARTSFFVPSRANGYPPLSVRARLTSADGSSSGESKAALSLREESPATPHLYVKWKELQLKPGEIGHAEAKVRDAADEPIANHPIVYWTGPKGTSAPTTDDEWKKSGKNAATNGLGELVIESPSPRVVTSLGSEVSIVVRTEIEGQKLEQRRALSVGQPVASATIELEGGAIVPGLTQRAYLYVSDGEHGVAGEFTVDADGLRGAKVTTDAHGDGEITWTVPEDVGASRPSGPCANNVAASVVVRQTKPIAALARHPEPFELCATVERDRAALLRTSVHVARIGDKVKTTVESAKRAAKGSGSLVVAAPEGFGATFWTKEQGDAEIDLSNTTPGIHDITLAIPRTLPSTKESEIATTRILVVPKTLPKLTAKVVGGRHAPGGDAEIDVVMSDGKGTPITGSITAVSIDKEGGGSVAGLDRLDARLSLCDSAGVPRERCDAFLDNDPTADLLRRERLTTQSGHAQAPIFDPAAHTTGALTKTFSDVLHSLEGAVFQSSSSAESLRDVRRRDKNQWAFNPELMTLVTAAMSDAPTTPGGEPFGLTDLIAVDPQVTFDNVARRVTRLKLFNVLAAVRTFKNGEQITPDEPVLNDPNAIVRQLVRDEKLTQDALLDPWGGTIQFVKTNGQAIPFLTAARGFSLQAPGPDGKIGTGDDVKDPFERVVRTNSPYATAMGEDEIVDAKWNMRVGDATVTGWQEMFARLTGTVIGHGSGTGSGQGFGSGHGSLGGSHTTKAPTIRMGSSIVTETARWTEPVRTDAQGHARIKVPLGDYETTWRIALLARTDAGQSAVTAQDVPAFLPISVRVDAGKKLTLGDEISARVIVRNRTASAKTASIDLASDGALALAPSQARAITIDVPPSSLRSAFIRIVTKAEGKGKINATLRAAGTDGDRTTQEIDVEPPGEPRVIATSAWIAGKSSLRVDLPPGYALRGNARVVVESGVQDALLAALTSAEPEPGMSPEALADTLEICARIEKLAEANGERWLVTRARKIAALTLAYLQEYLKDARPRTRAAVDRAALYDLKDPPPDGRGTKGPRKPKEGHVTTCPKDADLESAPLAYFLEAEPPPGANGPLPCFTALMSRISGGGGGNRDKDSSSGKGETSSSSGSASMSVSTNESITKASPLDIARAAMALFDRPHRAPLAMTLSKELAKTTRVDSGGPLVFEGTRGERAIVLSALARSAFAWAKADKDPLANKRMIEALLSLRDVRGGYGSSEATRDAVRALIAFEQRQPRKARVTITTEAGPKVIDAGLNGSGSLALAANDTRIDIDVAGASALVRLERPVLRNYIAAPDTTITALSVTADWPNDARAGTTGVVHVSYKLSVGHDAQVWTRLPLPPGVELAAPVKGVALRQGVIHIRTNVNGTETIALPVRFTLPGKMLIPEADSRTTSEDQPHALTPARVLVVR